MTGATAVTARARAMATDINVVAWGDHVDEVRRAVDAALEVFHDVETECTRFDAGSPLMRANAAGDTWTSVPPVCFAAVHAASIAYERTGGRFDPRVQVDLARLGYGQSISFSDGDVRRPGVVMRRAELPAWKPEFRDAESAIRIGPIPIDLGGIGKGLAVRWASEALRAVAPNHLIEAGGDCYAAGNAPDGEAWNIGIEDPFGGGEPLLVVAVRDRAVTTSSTRVRHWRVDGVSVHHLIDPRTGLPADAGLRAVTVLGDDPADAEVAAKVLLIDGIDGVQAEATSALACWVLDSGQVLTSAALDEFVVWRRP